MKALLFILLFLPLSFACGKEELLDANVLESIVIDNPYNKTSQPLSSFHGNEKKEILMAKLTAEKMGMKLPKMFVARGVYGNAIARCINPKYTNTMSIFTDEIVEMKKDLAFQRNMEDDPLSTYLVLVYTITHEWAHCKLDMGHSSSGLMSANINYRTLDYDFVLEKLEDFNSRHPGKINVEAFKEEYARLSDEMKK
jgi:hypothetical protein